MRSKLNAMALLMGILATTSCRDTGNDTSSVVATDQGKETKASWPKDFLRTDGYYHGSIGKVSYVMRYLPSGEVMLLGGMTDDPKELASQLTPDAVTGPTTNIHKAPVEVRGDSLFFITVGIKGEIDYFGHRRHADTLMFRKYSHITGKEATLPYVFVGEASAIQ